MRKRAVERAAAGILKVTVEMCLDEAREGMRRVNRADGLMER